MTEPAQLIEPTSLNPFARDLALERTTGFALWNSPDA
jgi:hypothetical protein